jgi:tetratricopeptide (TPR) repeat protein
MAREMDAVQQQRRPLTPAEREAYELGRRSYERGDVGDALAQFGRLLRTRSGFADVHYMVGTLHERRDELDSAMQSLREALRINPSSTEALVALASLYERQGDFERSREIAERARATARSPEGALDPTTRGKLANLQAQLGDAYREVGDLAEAVEQWKTVLDRDPERADARMYLGLVRTSPPVHDAGQDR